MKAEPRILAPKVVSCEEKYDGGNAYKPE